MPQAATALAVPSGLDDHVDEARKIINAFSHLHDPAVADFQELDRESVRRLRDLVLELSRITKSVRVTDDVNYALELLVRLDQNSDDRDAVAQAENLARLERALEVLLIRSTDAFVDSSPHTALTMILDPDEGLGDQVAAVADLLDVTPKTVRSWRDGDATIRQSNARKVFAVAHLVRALTASLTTRGILLWFDEPLAIFGGRPPRDVVLEGNDDEVARLVKHARGNRG